MMINDLIPASDRALVPLEVRPAVRKVGISGGRPGVDAGSRLSGDVVMGKKTELAVKSGEEEGGMRKAGSGEEEKTNHQPVIESHLPVSLVSAPRQRLQSTSNTTQQVDWNEKLKL